MTVSIGVTEMIVLCVLVTACVATAVAVAGGRREKTAAPQREWAEGLPWTARARFAWAATGYDFWLSLRGVGRGRRRELCEELRANLVEAAARVGARQAVAAVGPMRAMARNAVLENSGPSWSRGAVYASCAGAGVLVLQAVLTTVWLDAASASGAPLVEGGVTAVPGMRLGFASPASDALSIDVQTGPAALVVAGVVFLLVARPWMLRRQA